MTETELMDKILMSFRPGHFLEPLSDEDFAKYATLVEKAKLYGLCRKSSKYSWELTQEGLKALEMGGFAKWLEAYKENENKPPHSIHVNGNAVIGNNNSGVTQGSRLRDLTIAKSDTAIPNPNEIKQDPSKSTILNIIIGIVISIIAGAILLYLEHKTNLVWEPLIAKGY